MSKKPIGLNPKIDIDFPISEEVTITVSYKDLRGKKQKELAKKYKELNKVQSSKDKTQKRINLLEMKAESLQEIGEHDEVIKDIDALTKLYDTLDKFEQVFETLGGYEAYEDFQKEQFDLCVTAGDKKDLKILTDAIDEESSYFEVMQMITKAVSEKKGN